MTPFPAQLTDAGCWVRVLGRRFRYLSDILCLGTEWSYSNLFLNPDYSILEVVFLVNLMMDIAGYLDDEAAAAVLLRLDVKHGRLNGELEEVLHISPTTLSERLTEAQRLDLIERTRLADDHGNSKRYVLTERGQAVVSKLKEHDLKETYEEFFQAHEDLEAGKSEVQDWVEDSTVTHPDYPPESDQPERP